MSDMTSTQQRPPASPQGTGSTAGQLGAGWAPVPESSLGPVIPERGYDLRREALRALAEVDQLPSWQYVHNVYGMFTNHFNRIASRVAEELLPKWKGRLAGVDFFIHNHSFIMLEALRVDWNAEPFVVLPPPSLITEGN
jgi:hypothetical protein